MPKRIDKDGRRAEIAEALWAVVVEQGVSAVSIRSVATRAGIAVGSLRHVFPTREELVAYAAELMLDRASERIASLPDAGPPSAYAMEICRQLLPLDADRRAELEVNLALVADAPAIPSLADLRDRTHRDVAELCRGCLALVHEIGVDEIPDRHVRRLHALLDGVALHLLHTSDDADPTWAEDLVREELFAPL